MSKVKELMEKRNDVLVKMEAIIDKAEEEVRAMTETEQQEYDKYKTELKGLNATIQAAEERAKQEAGDDPKGQEEKTEEVIGENEAKALYSELYKQAPRKKNLSMLVKDIYKSSDTEKYVYELKDNKYIETVFIKRRDGGTVCVSTQVGCPVGCIFCESGRNGFVRNLTPSEIVQQVILLRRKVNRIVFIRVERQKRKNY